jgi:hypothetical protein
VSTEWSDVVTDGLMNYIELTEDGQEGKLGAQCASLLKPVISPHIRPDDRCSYAYATILVQDNRLIDRCLVMILVDRMHAFWEIGTFRRKSGVETVPLATITDVTVGRSPIPRARDATVMTVTHTYGKLEVLLPRERTEHVAAALKAVLMPSGVPTTPPPSAPPPPPPAPTPPTAAPQAAIGPRACPQPGCAQLGVPTADNFCPACGTQTQAASAPPSAVKACAQPGCSEHNMPTSGNFCERCGFPLQPVG